MSYTTRQAILTCLAAERAEWDALMAQADPARVSETGITGDWSFKDTVVHLVAWRQRFVDELVAALQGTPVVDQHWPVPIDPMQEGTPEGEALNDQVNAWFMETGRSRTWEQVRAQDSLQWVVMTHAFALLPETLLNDPRALPSLKGQTLAEVMTGQRVFGHFHEEHEASMRALIARSDRGLAGANDALTCANCGGVIGQEDLICPQCGISLAAG